MVFLDFFYALREAGLKVTLQEWRMLLTCLEKGLHDSSVRGFYHVARACLVKSEADFDTFNGVFAAYFKDVEGAIELPPELLAWLAEPKPMAELTEEMKAALEHLDIDELMRRFQQTLAEQKERHDGGSRWVGTGGRSPFGHGGHHPTGIRVGGAGGGGMAMKVLEDRRFRDYRTDVTLDVRNVKLALRRLRQLTRTDGPVELDVDETVDRTCREAGEIELVFRPRRKNDVRLLLLMDVGGTMDPYYEPVSRLLSALHEERGLRDFKAFYFHNCVYERVFETGELMRKQSMLTADLMRTYGERWKLMIVGDASMHPSELTAPRGNINPRMETEGSGLLWLGRLERHFGRAVWLNPEMPEPWLMAGTVRTIASLFPMYPLTIDGIERAVKSLVGARAETAHAVLAAGGGAM
ncbi:MAG: VWA domain-containing protein [Myxococcota bacterium]